MPKEEIINRFDEKIAEVQLRAVIKESAINKAKTKEEKRILYKEVKVLFCIIQNFNNLEKIEFYKWFFRPCKCDNEFEIINIENIKADMQSALEVAEYDSLIKDPSLPYSSILDKPINDLCYYLNSLDYINTDYEKFFMEFLSLFIGCVECECICDNRSMCDDCKRNIILILMMYFFIMIFVGGICLLVALHPY